MSVIISEIFSRRESWFRIEGDPKGGISRLAKMRKPQCTIVHEDFRIKRNAEITLLSHPPEDNKRYKVKFYNLDDNRFKKGQSLTHFKELIDRIREIRLSEKVFPEYKEKQRHLEKIESLKELERDLSEYRRSSDCI